MESLFDQLQSKFDHLTDEDKKEVLSFINHIQEVHKLEGLSRQEKALQEIQKGLTEEIVF